jgi:hypothetical protein
MLTLPDHLQITAEFGGAFEAAITHDDRHHLTVEFEEQLELQ